MVEVLAEPLKRRLRELLRLVARRLVVRDAADDRVCSDHRAVDVGDRRVRAVALGVETGAGIPLVSVTPVDELPRGREVGVPVGELVEAGRQGAPGRKRLAGLVVVRGVPPQTAVGGPPAAGDELERARGVAQVAMVVRGSVGVDEREPPPSVVVEPCLLVAPAVARVGRVSPGWLEGLVEVPLRLLREGPDGRAVALRGLRDCDSVDRLEQGNDAPDRGERIAVSVVQTVVVPAPPGVPPVRVRGAHGLLRDREELGALGRELGPRGQEARRIRRGSRGRGRGADKRERAGDEQGGGAAAGHDDSG